MITRNNIKVGDEVVCMNWSGVILERLIKMTTKYVVKSWDELLPIAENSSDTALYFSSRTSYHKYMEEYYKVTNYIIDLKLESRGGYTYRDSQGHYLSKIMIKRKAYKNDL